MDRVNEIPSGVYRHYRGSFYQVLFLARVVDRGVAKDADAHVYVEVEEDQARVLVSGEAPAQVHYHLPLFVARAHDTYPAGTRVAVYVPLYTGKPGRRVSVRAVEEFGELVDEEIVHEVWLVPIQGPPPGYSTQKTGRQIPRFTYVGDVIPEEKLW